MPWNRKSPLWLSPDPSFYVQNACATERSLAPKGMSTLLVVRALRRFWKGQPSEWKGQSYPGLPAVLPPG